MGLAKKFSDLGLDIYATKGTAETIRTLGIEVTDVDRLSESDEILRLMDEDKIDYIVYTGKTDIASINDYIRMYHHAILLGITTLTSLDTANALADIIASRFNEDNTELVDINALRKEKTKISFLKMQSCGNDYIFIDNMDGKITCPESLAINFVDRHYGIGGDGIALIEKSDVADAKMRIFNQDGSEGAMAGNSIRCVAKYLYDNGFVRDKKIRIETLSGVKELTLYTFNGKVSSVSVDMGKAVLNGKDIPSTMEGETVVGREIEVGGQPYKVTLVNVGNPHCVVFCDKVDAVDLAGVGPLFEHAPCFPERINTEFVRVVNDRTLKMRVWERGNGETLACGTGAAACVVAAVLSGYCKAGEDITVKVRGGDLFVRYDEDGRVTLTGNTKLVYEGTVEF